MRAAITRYDMQWWSSEAQKDRGCVEWSESEVGMGGGGGEGGIEFDPFLLH